MVGQLRLIGTKTNLIISSAAVFLSCFVLSFVASSFIIQPQGTKAVTGLTLVSTPTMALTADNGTKTLNPNPTQNSGLASGVSTLTASTDVPTGYNLSLAATSIGAGLNASTGTLTSPIALVANTWGYALTKAGAVGMANNFDASYTSPTPSTTSKWANPTTTTTIKKTANSTANDQTNVYYGTKIDATLPSGTYTSTVTYTATANITNIPTPSITSVNPSTGTTAGGTSIQIVGTGFTVNDQSVTTAVTIGGQACQNVTISSNTPTTGSDTVYCTTPAYPTAGAVDTVITTWGGSNTATSSYTYITPANVTFVSPNQASTIAGTESGPAFTIAGTGFTGATQVTIGGQTCTSFEVVSDTHIFCKAPNTINTTGSKAVIVTKSNVTGASTANVTYSSTNYPTLQASDAFNQCTTTAKIFRDTRDSQLYYVKKMPDNKCWMVDNLKYANYGELSKEDGKHLTADGMEINATNADIAKYVDPGSTAYCAGNTNLPANTNTKCGLLYNWFTATRGTGTYATSTPGDNVTDSICPANFRLPSGQSDGITPTSDGTSYAAADFAVLSASINAGYPVTGTTGGALPAPWMPTGIWSGIFSGLWSAGFDGQSEVGYFWSSSAGSATTATTLFYTSSRVHPGGSSGGKHGGLTVRCVMEAPKAKTGDAIQTVTTQNCPTTRTRVVDARDDATYWVQKMGDGKCWMLTNLAYGGGGTNTYGDTRSITLNSTNTGDTYTAPQYYIPAGNNRTTGTTDPSISTNGTGQYGYLYNWCAAMGAQTGTDACSSTDTTDANTNISICPSGWRLPGGGASATATGNDFGALNTAENNGSTSSSSGLLSSWLGQYSSYWNNGFHDQGSSGRYWSSTQYSRLSAHYLHFNTSIVGPGSNANNKSYGYAVRCIAV